MNSVEQRRYINNHLLNTINFMCGVDKKLDEVFEKDMGDEVTIEPKRSLTINQNRSKS